ncbi:hypothetical protein [Vreelandella sp. TE19]
MKISHNGTVYYKDSFEGFIEIGIPVEKVTSFAKVYFEQEIDAAAGTARAAFVSPGSYIEQEYLLAKQEAADWLANGKDEEKIPSSVQDHITMFEVDAETAAKEIVATAHQWEQALSAIRSARLGGKAAVSRASTIEEAEVTAQQAIEKLDKYRPPRD